MKGQQQPSPSWSAAAGHTARLPGSASECWSLWALCSLCSPWALFHCAPWHQVAVAGKKKEMLFSKCCGMRLNASQLNIENITKSTRANNQVGGGVLQALCAASTWPENLWSHPFLFFWLLSHNTFGLSAIFWLVLLGGAGTVRQF